jgi:hypothetical protein
MVQVLRELVPLAGRRETIDDLEGRARGEGRVAVDEGAQHLEAVLAPAHGHLAGVHAVEVARAQLALQGAHLCQALVAPPVVQRVDRPQVSKPVEQTSSQPHVKKRSP